MAVIVVAVLVLYLWSSPVNRLVPSEKQESLEVIVSEELTSVPASGNVDDAVNAILQGLTVDEIAAAEAELDAELIDADAQAIADFGESYDASQY